MLSCTATVTFPHSPDGVDPRDVLRRFLLLDQPQPRLSQVKQLHARILRLGLADHIAFLPPLLRLYSSHARFDLAARLFHPVASVSGASYLLPSIAWNLSIRAHALAGAPLDALRIFRRMAALDVPPDKFTFPFLLKGCSELGTGKAVQAFAIKLGFHQDRFFQNTLIHFYFSYGEPLDARIVFDEMRIRTIVSWTALVSGLLVCGEIDEARAVFEVMPARNVVSWTAMIDWYARNDLPEEALRLYRRMQEENVQPNDFTIVALSLACSKLGSSSLGRVVHQLARRRGGLDRRSVYVGTALVDMYSKCGSIWDAKKVFEQMPERSLVTWNTMITSLAVHGQSKEALAMLGEMENANVRPDHVTFVGILSACAREGMVEEGCRYLMYMMENYGIRPCYEHLCCLVELFGSGASEEALEVAARKLESAAAVSMLVKACRSSKNGDTGVVQAVNNLIHGLEMSNDDE